MQRDYILRMIEQLAAMVARLRQMIVGGEAKSLSELESEAAKHGLDLKLARMLDPDSLVLLLSPGGDPEPTRCWIFAELLYLEGLHAEVTGRPHEALSSYERSLRLFLVLDPRVIGGIPEATERIAELEARIGSLRG